MNELLIIRYPKINNIPNPQTIKTETIRIHSNTLLIKTPSKLYHKNPFKLQLIKFQTLNKINLHLPIITFPLQQINLWSSPTHNRFPEILTNSPFSVPKLNMFYILTLLSPIKLTIYKRTIPSLKQVPVLSQKNLNQIHF